MNDQKGFPSENNGSVKTMHAPLDLDAPSAAPPESKGAAEGAAMGPLRGDEVNWIPEPSRGHRIVKRLIDVVASFTMALLMLPLFFTIAAAIKLTSGGPVLFRQTRLGYHGKPFTFLKFRTMYGAVDARIHQGYVRQLIAREREYQTGGVHQLLADPRITPLGRFLRWSSLDELPQHLNVLRGDMSLVGPRPPIPYEWEAYESWHKLRLSRKPGIIGSWTVKGRSALRFDDMVRLDIEYCKSDSILLDLKILLETPIAVFRDRSAY